MKEKKITQAILAESIGFARTQLSDYFNDRRGFSEERKEQIASYFETTYLDMLNYGRSVHEDSPLLKESANKGEQSVGKEAPDYIISKYEYLIETLTNEVDRKTEDIKSLKKEIEDYKKDVEDYKGFLKDYREGIKKFKEENENLVREISELKTQLQGSGKKEAS
ncbi:MAG: helix-turn-helix domain-containing protein [Desulfobacteraceae bacterium]